LQTQCSSTLACRPFGGLLLVVLVRAAAHHRRSSCWRGWRPLLLLCFDKVWCVELH
jgi:hypothetical protein